MAIMRLHVKHSKVGLGIGLDIEKLARRSWPMSITNGPAAGRKRSRMPADESSPGAEFFEFRFEMNGVHARKDKKNYGVAGSAIQYRGQSLQPRGGFREVDCSTFGTRQGGIAANFTDFYHEGREGGTKNTKGRLGFYFERVVNGRDANNPINLC